MKPVFSTAGTAAMPRPFWYWIPDQTLLDLTVRTCYFSSIMLEKQQRLSRRERQIMDVLIARGRASASEIQSLLPDPPGYSAIRATLRVMEEKGYIRHEQAGPAYIYLPKIAPERAKRSAVKHLLNAFFAGSPERMVAALLDVSSGKIAESELARIAEMIEQARQEGR